MRSVLLSILAAATLFGVAKWHRDAGSVVALQTASMDPKALPIAQQPAIAFKPGSGGPPGATSAASKGHIYGRLTPFYTVEVVLSSGTYEWGPGGEALETTAPVGHDKFTPGPSKPGNLILYDKGHGIFCWKEDVAGYFDPFPLPSPGVPVVIRSKDKSVFVVTSKEC